MRTVKDGKETISGKVVGVEWRDKMARITFECDASELGHCSAEYAFIVRFRQEPDQEPTIGR